MTLKATTHFFRRFGFLLLLCLFLLTIPLQSQKENPTTPVTESKIIEEKPSFIPLNEINEEIRKFYLLVNKYSKETNDSLVLRNIKNQVENELKTLNVYIHDSIYTDFETQNLRVLEYKQRYWKSALSNSEEINKEISNNLEKLDKVDKELGDKRFLWQGTSDSIETKFYKDLPEVIELRVKAVIDSINLYSSMFENNRTLLLSLQEKMSVLQFDIQKIISEITKYQIHAKSELLTIDYIPIWESSEDDTLYNNSIGSIGEVIKSEEKSLRLFIAENGNKFIYHLLIFLLILLIAYYFKRKYKDIENILSGSKDKFEFKYFMLRPFSSSLFVSLFVGFFIYTQKTDLVISILILLILISIILVLFKFVTKRVLLYFVCLLSLFLLNIFTSLLDENVAIQRWIYLFSNLTILLVLVAIFRQNIFEKTTKTGLFLRILVVSLPVFFVLLLISLIVNIMGAVGFASLITSGFVELSAMTLILYTALYLFGSVFVIILNNRLKKNPTLEDTYGHNLPVSVLNIFRVAAVIAWVISAIRIFGLMDFIDIWLNNVLKFTVTVGDTEIVLGVIFIFFFILIVSFLSSKFIRMFLDFEIFTRITLPRGIPGVISMIIRYSIISLGIYIAISSLGIDLKSFGLFAGAIGVGLGFGLQNIISNFFSGIILAFERPVQVGDTVELDSVFGKVKNIGVRSSIVKTFDGSEVVLPNNDLISKQLTNWTMMDTRRRVKLNIKIAFGHDPHDVIEIIYDEIKKHDDVLIEPKPFVAFEGFGNNFLEFSVYYWIQSDIIKSKSEMALSIYDTLTAKGIQSPLYMGKMDVNFLNDRIDESITEKKKKNEDLDLDSI